MSLEQRRNLLIELLNDSEEEVRTAAAAALERLESFQDLSKIVEELASDKRGQRVKAIFAMECQVGGCFSASDQPAQGSRPGYSRRGYPGARGESPSEIAQQPGQTSQGSFSGSSRTYRRGARPFQ